MKILVIGMTVLVNAIIPKEILKMLICQLIKLAWSGGYLDVPTIEAYN